MTTHGHDKIFGALLLALLCATTAAQNKEAPSVQRTYKQLRYDEDWSFLADSGKRADALDPLKYIPLGKEGWYLSLGGEVRERYEYYGNEGWGLIPGDGNSLLQRYMLHADLHLGSRVRFFGQLKSGLETGRRIGPRPPDADRLDVHQAFVDARFSIGQAAITLRGGRQELSFGSSRLVSTREGPNVRQSFDGLRLTVKSGGWTVDGFATKPVETNQGIFDDGSNKAQTFWGVYAVRPFKLAAQKVTIDLYYFGLDRKQARFYQGTAREQRQTLGARVWNQGEAADYNYELAYQFGSFGRGQIRAWTAASDQGYTFRRARFSPRLGVKADVTSGDRDPRNPDLQTFNPLFPRGAYFGEMNSVGPLNHIDLHPSLNLALSKKIGLSAETVFFWRQSLQDGVYGVPNALLHNAGRSNGRYLGTQPQLELRWQIDRHISFTAHAARFIAGRFLRETPPGRDMTYFSAWATYKF